MGQEVKIRRPGIVLPPNCGTSSAFAGGSEFGARIPARIFDLLSKHQIENFARSQLVLFRKYDPQEENLNGTAEDEDSKSM